ncbi:hypothetical protein V6N13_036289 [Hibiscus sabdariffa]|uniref:Endoglucanase n=2 Tax=Hibiscus sabdariffa TaxID=183260 RepID=A0ABR2S719_9ROSI
MVSREIVWGLALCLCCTLAMALAGSSHHGQAWEDESLSHDYKDALAKAILFFEGQRSGKLPASQRVKWRGDSALTDGKPDKVNLVGGYYDAGDNVKFVWPMAFTVTMLSWAAVEYGNEISSAGELNHLRTAIRWGTDFILQARTSSTTLYTQVGDGNTDHQCWERPEDMDTPRTLYKITSDSPGSEAAGEAAAALSAASIVFKGVDSKYSRKLLRKSRSLFKFADKYRGTYNESFPFYRSFSGYQDELLWSAAWLYKASGDKKYLNYVVRNQGWSEAVLELSWDTKYPGAQALLAKEFYGGKKDLSKYVTDLESFICAVMPGSSSLKINTTAEIALICNMLQARAWCCPYMVGYGSKYPMQLHHRGSSIPSIYNQPSKVGCEDGSRYLNSNNPNPNQHVGAIVGGPDSNDQFKDQRSDYSHTEPTTYMNAAFVGAVAALLDEPNQEALQNTQINTIINLIDPV